MKPTIRTLLEISLVIALVATTVLYLRSRQESERIQLLAAYFSQNTRDLIEERSSFIDKQINTAKKFSVQSNRERQGLVTAHLESLRHIMDSANILLQNIKNDTDPHGRALAYEAYKSWITGKKKYFVKTSEEFKWLFNPVFGLDKSLMPESLFTNEELIDADPGILLLEDAVSYALYREVQASFVDIVCFDPAQIGPN